MDSFLYLPMTMGELYPSGPAVTHCNLAVFHDDGYVPLPARMGKHLIESALVLFHVIIESFFTIGRPGLIGVGSAGLPIDDDLVRHGKSSSFF